MSGGYKSAHCRLASSLVVVGAAVAEEEVVVAAEGGNLPEVRRWAHMWGQMHKWAQL